VRRAFGSKLTKDDALTIACHKRFILGYVSLTEHFDFDDNDAKTVTRSLDDGFELIYCSGLHSASIFSKKVRELDDKDLESLHFGVKNAIMYYYKCIPKRRNLRDLRDLIGEEIKRREL